jgi:putative FmdB family regulatory protein
MPFYEYECQACGKYLETLQKISEPPLIDCPDCGRPELKKRVSAAGFRLKGGGWYETDFKGKDRKKNLADGAAAEKGGDKGGDKGGEAGSDAKPAPKPESGQSSPAQPKSKTDPPA